MNKVFIGGSRKISRLTAEVLRRIDRIVEQHLPILVGDAGGVDRAIQRYLKERAYRNVEVYCTGNRCRNNLGEWAIRSIPVRNRRRDRRFYTVKDRAMAEDATFGLMIWDGESLGTLLNVCRMSTLHKPTVVYDSAGQRFVEVRQQADIDTLLATAHANLRLRLEESLAAESAESA